MATEGQLHVGVYWNGATLTGCSIRSSRPLHAGRLMMGKPVQKAVDTVSMLFSLCGRAQGAAAAMAAEAALGIEVRDAVRMARQRLIMGEMLQEYLWRILCDWPAQAGREPQARLLAAVLDSINRFATLPLATGGWKTVGGGPVAETGAAWTALLQVLRELLQTHVFAQSPMQWLDLGTPEAFASWLGDAPTTAAGFLRDCHAARFGTSEVAFMARPDAVWLRQAAQAMDGDAEFVRRPHLDGAALETGALARQRRHPLLRLPAVEGNAVFARQLARLIELASVAAGETGAAWSGALSLGEGEGLAWVETARGLLLHRVATDGERILRYCIVAPTEWNFHPQGALARGLAGVPAASEAAARSRTEWLVQSLDPCVSCEITVHRTEHGMASST